MGNDISVSLATNATGALASTAAQVVAAINAHPGRAPRSSRRSPTAATWARGSSRPAPKVNLSDFLNAPAHVAARSVPADSVMRIGSRRDGKHTGVFLYCQQHAREWATPLTCLETAEQILRNYAIDPQVKKLVDNLEIFILPSSNPDGSHYSLYDFNSQRKNMTPIASSAARRPTTRTRRTSGRRRLNPVTGVPYTNSDPASRTAWGTDMNRNNTVGTLFDGYIGASTSCTSEVFTGLSEASEPEIQNELWIADTFKNIKFSNNIHSFGGYFMWAPGTYLPNRDEGEAVHANIGVEKYFFAAGDQILNRIKDVRGTVILPERTGPIADVLYSAAGNSADEHWYNRGVIAYSFETGADRYVDPTLSVATPVGATGVRASNRNGFRARRQVVVGFGTANAETRTITAVAVEQPAEPAAERHPRRAADVRARGRRGAARRRPPGAGRLPAGLRHRGQVRGARVLGRQLRPPRVGLRVRAGQAAAAGQAERRRLQPRPVYTTFQFVNEPSVIRYTLDGSKPNMSSTLWDSSGPREPGQVFYVTSTTTFRWLATDMRGNQSFGTNTITIGNP